VEVPNGDARDLHRKCEKKTDLIVQCWDKDKTKFGRCVPGEMMFVLDDVNSAQVCERRLYTPSGNAYGKGSGADRRHDNRLIQVDKSHQLVA
jgi:hypothetical protein